MSKLEANRNAMAEIRRAQEEARRAAAERAAAAVRERMLEAQARKAEEASRGAATEQTVIERDTFVKEADFAGATEEQRGELFDNFDTDGETGLSEEEFDAAYAANAETAPAGEVSDGVQEQVEHALKDDTDTKDDLLEAAGKVETPADVQEIMAAAQTREINQTDVLREVLKGQDGNSDEPNTEVFEAVAAEFDRLEKPELATAVRYAGDPAITPGVRGDLVKALQDEEATGQDLYDAARNHVETPADLDAIFAAQEATGQGEPKEILRAALLHLDERSDEPNTELIAAIGDRFGEMGDDAAADALAVAADPETTVELRKEIIHGLQDDTNTEQDIRDIARLADNDTEVGAGRDVGESQDVEETDALIAMGQVETAKAAFDEAAAKVAQIQADIQVMADTAGLTPEQRETAVAEFAAQHQADFEAMETAQAELARTIEENQAGLQDILEDPAALQATVDADRGDQGVSTDRASTLMNERLKTITDSLGVVARDPAHHETVAAIVTPVLEKGAALDSPSDAQQSAMGQLVEGVVPGLIESSVIGGLGGEPNQASVEAAFTAFEKSDLGEAVAGLSNAKTVFENVSDLQSGYEQLRAVSTGGAFVDGTRIKSAELTGTLEDLQGKGKFGASFAGLGAALNTVSLAQAWNSEDPLATGGAAASTASDMAALIGSGGGRLAGITALSDYLGPVGDALGAVQGIKDGEAALETWRNGGDRTDLARGLLTLGGAAAGVAALMSVPGANLAGAVLAGALVTANIIETNVDDNAQASRILDAVDQMRAENKFDPPLTDIGRELMAFDLPGTKGHARTFIERLQQAGVQMSDNTRQQLDDWIHDAADGSPKDSQEFMNELWEKLDSSIPGQYSGLHDALNELARQLHFDPVTRQPLPAPEAPVGPPAPSTAPSTAPSSAPPPEMGPWQNPPA